MEMILTPEAERFIEEWHNPLPYIVAHTSGSTGRPKETRLLKSDMRSSARATIDFFNINSSSLLYLPLSPDYIAGKMQIVRALEASCSLICVRPSSSPVRQAENLHISLLPVVPSQISGLIQHIGLSKIDNLIIGGAPLDSHTEQRVISAGLNAYATYGMTETCSHVAMRRLGEEHFIAMPGFNFSVDERNCLVIESVRMSFGRLATNDIVNLINSTSFVWRGRFDNVINSGGIKIQPEELELIIAPYMPENTIFYISSRKSEKWGEEPVIVTNSETVSNSLLQQLRDILGSKSSPKDIIIDKEIRFTDSKKLIRRKF